MGFYNYLASLVDVTALPPRDLPRKAWPFLRRVALQQWRVLLPCASLNLILGILLGFLPYFWKRVVDVLSSPLTGAALAQALIWPIGLYVLFTVVLSPLIRHATYYLQAATVDTSVGHLLTRQLYHYQLGQSLAVIQDELSGRLANKVNSVASRIRMLLMSLSQDWVREPVVLITSLVTLLTVSPWLAIPLACWLLPFVLSHKRLLPRLNKLSQQAADANSTTFGRMVDTLGNMALVKLFSHSGREDAKILETIETERDLNVKNRLGWVGFYALEELFDVVLQIATLGIVIWLRIEGRITTGDVVMAMALISRAAGSIESMARNVTSLLENLAVIDENLEIVTRPYMVTDAPDARPLPRVAGAIRFDSVSFSYTAEAQSVIRNLSLMIPAGQKVGLIGLSGAGKSTLLNLLLRFHDVSSGAITIDGHDIRQVTQESLRAQIAVVAQDTALLHRSIADNIAYGREEATRAEIEAVARRAQAHDFIQGLQESISERGGPVAFHRRYGVRRGAAPAIEAGTRHGYDAYVGERGVKLSGGQRQRIALARLILKDAPILLLDEATSALDSEVEAAIQDGLNEVMAGRTVIAIAHRLSTIARLDRLLVLEAGRIVEDGTHVELLAKSGRYAALWQRQSGGFLQE